MTRTIARLAPLLLLLSVLEGAGGDGRRRPPPMTVGVQDCTEIGDVRALWLKSARQSEASGRWGDALTLYFRLHSSEDAVFPAEENDPDWPVRRYLGLQYACREAFRRLQQRDSSAVGDFLEPRAAARLDAALSAEDTVALERIAADFSCVPSGYAALGILGNAELELGHTARAQSVWRRYLTAAVGEAPVPRSDVRKALGFLEIVNSATAARAFDGLLARALPGILPVFRTVHALYADGLAGSRGLAELERGGKPRWRLPLAAGLSDSASEDGDSEVGSWIVMGGRVVRARAAGPSQWIRRVVPFRAAVADGTLLLADGEGLWGVGIRGPEPELRWRAASAVLSGDGEDLRGLRRLPHLPGGVAVGAGRAYVVASPSSEVEAEPTEPERGSSQMSSECSRILRAVDLHTGKVLWSTDHAPDRATREFFGQAGVGGQPLFHEDRIYVGTLSEDPEPSAGIVCLDAGSGRLLWHRRLHAFAPAEGVGQRGHPPRLEMGRPSIHGGRVYMATNLGAVAALDFMGGAIVWIVLYGREEGGAPAPWYEQPWEQTAPICVGENLFVAPRDTNLLLVLHAASGRLQEIIGTRQIDWWARGSTRQAYAYHWLAADLGGWVYLVGGSVLPLDGRSSLPSHGSAGGRRRNVVLLPEAAVGPPVCLGEKLLIPTRKGLLMIDYSGRAGTAAPLLRWPRPTEHPREILLCGDGVLVVSAEAVEFYGGASDEDPHD